MEKTLRIYLDHEMKKRTEARKHNFLFHVQQAVESKGWQVEYCVDSDEEMVKSIGRDGRALFHMGPATNRDGLTFRLAYVYPFWKIEKTAKRWDFEIAGEKFDQSLIDPAIAKDFVDRARRRLFGWMTDSQNVRDVIYVPLQGWLLHHRSHQKCSPIDMVHQVVETFPFDRIEITMHPRASYSKAELDALHEAINGHSLARISYDSPKAVIPSSKLVVTQNSTSAFQGLFFNLPVVLFGKSDFHHASRTLENIGEDRPNHEKFLYWFLQEKSINAGRDDVQTKILDRMRELGWAL